MGEDEVGTIQTLNAYKEVMAGLIQHHRGRVVDAPGDNLLAEFGSVVDAVQCAVEIQKELKTRNAKLPENRRMEFRIGVNLGDVVEDGEQILGDGVNIAARLESLSEAGGICISGTAFDQVKNKLNLGYKYLGEQTVKNILEPVRVYQVLTGPEAAGKVIGEKKAKPRQWQRAGIGLVVAMIVVVTSVVIWRLYLRPTPPLREVASKEKMAFPLPDKPSIAVLPFVNMSKDPDQEYFSDGMTEDLITDLSKISGLLVIARNSTFTYKGKPVKVKQVAEELGVRYVLEGSVRRAGDEIRINAQLIDAMTGLHLWAERYDGTIGKIFALQDQITQKIVSALAVKLTGSEKELVVQKGTNNVEAYDAFLRGWVYYLRLTPDDFTRAVASLKKAIELDPNYGRAYAVLSAVYYDATWSVALLKGLGVSWHEARARSIQYLQKAPKDPITHYVKSRMYVLRRQYQEGISEMERGLALDPNDPACHLQMGLALNIGGRPKDAVEFLRRGMRLDPHNPSRYLLVLGMAHFCMGELEEAAGLFEKAMRLNPETAPSWGCWLAASYGLLGRNQEARTALETTPLKKAWGDHPYSLRIFMYYHPFKDRAVADRYAEGLLKAGVSGKLNDYLPAFKENQLNGEEIKRLLFGSTITGFDWNWPFGTGQQWWMDNKENGEFTYRALGPISSDTGKSRIEGDMICWQYQKSFGGVEIRGTVFRYPGGTSKGKEEYFWCSDFGFSTFSLVK
jgi:TolB-like protein